MASAVDSAIALAKARVQARIDAFIGRITDNTAAVGVQYERELIAAAAVTLRGELQVIVTAARASLAGTPGPWTNAYRSHDSSTYLSSITRWVREAARDVGRVEPDERARAAHDALDSNLDRILESELHAADVERALNTFSGNARVVGVRWIARAGCCRLCYALANSDLDGLGAGGYALSRVPGRPHARCRCQLRSILAGAVAGVDARDDVPRRRALAGHVASRPGAPAGERARTTTDIAALLRRAPQRV